MFVTKYVKLIFANKENLLLYLFRILFYHTSFTRQLFLRRCIENLFSIKILLKSLTLLQFD